MNMSDINICGVVAEFDPFHNGHKYFVESVKQRLTAQTKKPTAIIAIISGNFVQRGTPACFNKYARAKAALLSGVDMIIELPVQYAIGTAEKFTFGGVKALSDTGIATHIAFGSECGNIELLQKCASAQSSEAVISVTKQYLSDGATYAKARQTAVCKLYGNEIGNLLQNPNDILATGYLSALGKLNSDISPMCILRNSCAHDSDFSQNGITSAANIRKMVQSGKDFSEYLPNTTEKIAKDEIASSKAPASLDNAQRAVLFKLRQMSLQDIARLPDISEGLENRIFQSIRSACNSAMVYDMIKTKRYTLARIRRIILAALLDISANEPEATYLHLLGFSNMGEQILKMMKTSSKLPIVSSYGDAKKLGGQSQLQFEKTAAQTDFYNLLLPHTTPCGEEYRQAVVKI